MNKRDTTNTTKHKERKVELYFITIRRVLCTSFVPFVFLIALEGFKNLKV